jgi:hypothetical protein
MPLTKASTVIDERVRAFHKNLLPRRCEITGDKATEVHELFPGVLRTACFYVQDCLASVSRQGHDIVQGNKVETIELLLSKLKRRHPLKGYTLTDAVSYYDKLKAVVTQLSLKEARHKCHNAFIAYGKPNLIEVEI